jgi:RpiB/LacA/LacB family sugar-phosphate isomerase
MSGVQGAAPSGPPTIAVGSDHAGFNLKRTVLEHLWARFGEANVLDLGPKSAARCDYPDYAVAVAEAVLDQRARFGVLICGTGVGISIAANKVPGIRAALCHDVTTARMARAHNDAQVLCLGARVVGDAVALDALDAFLDGAFEGGRHGDRLAKIAALESR